MRTIFLAFTTAMVIISPSHVLSQESPKVGSPGRIVTTLDMRENAWKEFKIADAELNKVFNELHSRLDDAIQKAKLRAAETAWLKYRDANANFESSLYEGGSIRPQIHTGCLTTMTQNRTKELQLILDSDFDH